MTVPIDPDPTPGTADANRIAPESTDPVDDVLDALRSVNDPEIGVNIVDLGLVYECAWTAAGLGIRMTVTSPSCPMADMLVDEVERVLRRRFPETPSIGVALVRDPPWSPERISEDGRRLLGWGTRSRAGQKLSWVSKLLRNRTRQ